MGKSISEDGVTLFRRPESTKWYYTYKDPRTGAWKKKSTDESSYAKALPSLRLKEQQMTDSLVFSHSIIFLNSTQTQIPIHVISMHRKMVHATDMVMPVMLPQMHEKYASLFIRRILVSFLNPFTVLPLRIYLPFGRFLSNSSAIHQKHIICLWILRHSFLVKYR